MNRMVAGDPIVVDMKEVNLPKGIMVVSFNKPRPFIYQGPGHAINVSLDQADIDSMLTGGLIVLDMEKMGLPKGELLIYHGETMKDMNRKLREAGLVTDDVEQTFHPGWNKDETKPLTEGDSA